MSTLFTVLLIIAIIVLAVLAVLMGIIAFGEYKEKEEQEKNYREVLQRKYTANETEREVKISDEECLDDIEEIISGGEEDETFAEPEVCKHVDPDRRGLDSKSPFVFSGDTVGKACETIPTFRGRGPKKCVDFESLFKNADELDEEEDDQHISAVDYEPSINPDELVFLNGDTYSEEDFEVIEDDSYDDDIVEESKETAQGEKTVVLNNKGTSREYNTKARIAATAEFVKKANRIKIGTTLEKAISVMGEDYKITRFMEKGKYAFIYTWNEDSNQIGCTIKDGVVTRTTESYNVTRFMAAINKNN